MNKPFIKLLRSPNSGYFYDVNRNEIVAIDEDTYSYLNSILNDETKFHSLETQKKFEQLQDMGYLSGHQVQKINHPYTKYLDILQSRNLSKITIQVTQNCNFRCKYCIYSENNKEGQRSHSAKKMSWETAKEAIDFLWNHSIDSEQINIGFYGGEPLLEFALIKKSIEYADKVFYGKDISYSITTNATLLNDSIIDYLGEHNVNIMISLDGPKEINDSNRVFAANGEGTFDTIISKIEHIKNYNTNVYNRMSISMVIDPQNDFDCINSVSINYEAVKGVNLQSSYIDTSYMEHDLDFSQDYISKNEYQVFLAILNEFKRYSKDMISPISIQAVSDIKMQKRRLISTNRLPDESAPSGPCIPGALRLFVNVDGDFFPCERVSEVIDTMKIGNLKSGFNHYKSNWLLNIGVLTEKECKNCWAFKGCTLCAKIFINDNDTYAETKLRLCEDIRERYSNRLSAIILFNEIETIYKNSLGVGETCE